MARADVRIEHRMSDFLAMGGYGFYVWMAYGGTALVIVAELWTLRARRRAAANGGANPR
jgi:heme exporter protein CcmD